LIEDSLRNSFLVVRSPNLDINRFSNYYAVSYSLLHVEPSEQN